MSYISFPVFRISLDIKWAHKSGYQVGINYTLNKQKEKKESCYFSHFLLKKKKKKEVDGLWPLQNHEFPFIKKV